jgi:hypothetical protein
MNPSLRFPKPVVAAALEGLDFLPGRVTDFLNQFFRMKVQCSSENRRSSNFGHGATRAESVYTDDYQIRNTARQRAGKYFPDQPLPGAGA